MKTTLIYDLGGVLIDWNPLYVFGDYFETTKQRDYFFTHICTSAWNEEQDAGRPLAEGTELLVRQFPEWEKAIRDYYGRWEEMLRGPIPDSVALLARLRARGAYRLYALTNWSAELFPIALQRFDFLHWFDGRVVSGEEKTRKPFREIYERLLQRYGVAAAEAVFIDDNERNVRAAQDMGIASIHFRNAVQLEAELRELGIEA